MAAWTKYWNEIKGDYLGFVDDTNGNVEELREKVIDTYLNSNPTFIKFCGDKIRTAVKKKIYFQMNFGNEVLDFGGVPFQKVKSSYMCCQYGFARRKSLSLEASQVGEEGPNKRKSFKIGCPALIEIREIVLYPNEKAVPVTAHNCYAASSRIKFAIFNGIAMETTRAYLIHFPRETDHMPHDSAPTEAKIPLDHRVRQKVRGLIADNVTSVDRIAMEIKKLVATIFEGETLPASNDRRFYPSKKDIAGFIYRDLKTSPNKIFNFHCIQKKMERWGNKENEFFLRKDNFLFVHQTNNQKHLLKRYGNNTCVLNATYKFKCALPVYFVCVGTNSSECVVATFFLDKDASSSVHEALDVIKEWNPHWHPHSFMMDGAEKEISEVKLSFPDTFVYLHASHIRRLWKKWTQNNRNELLGQRGEVIGCLRKIAASMTTDEFMDNCTELKMSQSYLNNNKLRDYVDSFWLREDFVSAWVIAFWPKDAIKTPSVDFKIEVLDGIIENNYLTKCSSKSLVAVLTVIIDEFLPKQWERYVKDNFFICTSKECENHTLMYRPKFLTDHLLEERKKAQENGDIVLMYQDALGRYYIKSGKKREEISEVDLDNQPSCQCVSFKTTGLPCMHILSVVEYLRGFFDWDSFAEEYKNHPFFVIDKECIEGIPPLDPDRVKISGSTPSENISVDHDPTENDYDDNDDEDDEFNDDGSNSEQCVANNSQVSAFRCPMLRESLKEVISNTYLMTDIDEVSFSRLTELTGEMSKIIRDTLARDGRANQNKDVKEPPKKKSRRESLP